VNFRRSLFSVELIEHLALHHLKGGVHQRVAGSINRAKTCLIMIAPEELKPNRMEFFTLIFQAFSSGRNGQAYPSPHRSAVQRRDWLFSAEVAIAHALARMHHREPCLHFLR
jgi:hypothetical protein